MDSGELLTRWTVRIAMICYALSLGLRIRDRGEGNPSSALRTPSPGGRRIATSLWVLGCLFYVVHVACAFQFFHHWSHAAAVEHTAVRSAEVVGWRFGGGVYFNYLFTVVWIFDAAWMLSGPESYARRPRWYDLLVHGYMLFMVLNATVVFGPSPTREIGAAVLVALAALWWRSRRYD